VKARKFAKQAANSPPQQTSAVLGANLFSYSTQVHCTGKESVQIQLAQCRFPGLANGPIPMLKYQYIIFEIKYTEAIISNSTQKLLRFEISKMSITV